MDFPKKRAPWWHASGTTLSADGTPLAFASGGQPDQRAIVCANGLGVSTFFWDYVGARFSKDHHVVVWDYRGHGASGAPADHRSLSIAGVADDMARVMDANNVERAVLLGHSLGCQIILEFYRLFPDRVLGLVPILGGFGHIADTFIDPRIGRKLYEAAYKIGSSIPDILNVVTKMTIRKPLTWHFARLSGLVHPDLCRKEDMDPYMEHLSRLDIRIFMEMARAAQEHDASPILGDIQVPTLVVAGERDLFTPRHLSVEMAGRIPKAELLEIPKGSHAALIEQPELINLRLEKFLSESVEAFEREHDAQPAKPLREVAS